jgi:hypothetical protein
VDVELLTRGSAYPLPYEVLVERIILILELRSRNFNRKFFNSKSLPGVGLELLNLGLLLLRLIH